MADIRPFVVHPDELPVERWNDQALDGVTWRTLVSSDRAPTDSMTVGVAEIEPSRDLRVSLHRHGPAETYVIVTGEGVVSIEGVDHRVRQGSTVFIPANAWHGVLNTSSDVMRLIYVFAVDSFADVIYEFPPSIDR